MNGVITTEELTIHTELNKLTSRNRARVQLLLEIGERLLVINPWKATFEVDIEEQEVERLNKAGRMTKHKIAGQKTLSLALEIRSDSFWDAQEGDGGTMVELADFFRLGEKFDLIYSPIESPGSSVLIGCLVTDMELAQDRKSDLIEENCTLTVDMVVDEVLC